MRYAPCAPAPEKDHRSRQRRGSAVLTGLLVLGLLATALSARAAPNEVLNWNDTAVKVATAGGQNGIK